MGFYAKKKNSAVIYVPLLIVLFLSLHLQLSVLRALSNLGRSVGFGMGSTDGAVFTLADVSKHNSREDCWLVINDKVYNVTKFLDDHPGGDEVLINATGKDATDDFEDVGHSTSARAMLDEYFVGNIDASTIPSKPKFTPSKQSQDSQDKGTDLLIKLLQFLVPLAILGLAVAVRFYTKSA